MKRLDRFGGWRQLLLRSMGWVHCGMIVALYYGSILQVIEGDSVLPQAVWRGMLVVVPLAAADFAGELCRKLWQFALVSLAACGLAWALLGYPLAAAPVAVVCFFRGKNRLSEEPVESLLDRPHVSFVLAAVVPFFYSALGGGPLLQKISLVWAACYLLLCCARSGLENIERYLSLNRDVAGVPVKRIVRTSGLAVLGMLLLAGVLLLPSLMGESRYFRIDPQTKKVQVQATTESVVMEAPDLPEELRELVGESSGFQIPPIISWLFMAVVGVVVAIGIFYGVYLILRNFRGTFVDHRDVVQYLRGPEDQEERSSDKKRKRPSFWDRSPNAQVRRRYRRAVERMAKEAPPVWAAPEEIEAKVGLQNAELHGLYEKARYSREGCSAQEIRELKG